MQLTRTFPAFGISLGVHCVILAAMAMIKMSLLDSQEDIAVETVFAEDRVQEEFSKELETETEIAETINAVSGGVVSTRVGSATGPVASAVKIETSENLDDPKINVNVAEISVPGDDLLGEDLGEGEVTGEVGAVVDGYGAALGRLTQELIRLMREQRILVVWLFDESDSMKDDQKEIRQKFHKVYEELGMVQRKDAQFKKGKEILLSAICGYGERIQELTPKPTAEIAVIRAAIDKIPIDESGKENMCQSISAAIDRYRPLAIKQRRRLVVVVVSDESGDDGGAVEETIAKAKRVNAPVYILGRESVFGYPYARIRWKDPIYGLWHWLRINRGPETAFPECLQWDGLRSRYDAFSAGFGPYEQVRIARESGGIFFVLPGEEENLTGPGAREKRRFDFLDMKQYQPLLLARKEYDQQRSRSEFRNTVWKVIVTLNPHLDEQLNIREWHYSINPVEFKKQGRGEFSKAVRAMMLTNQAAGLLEKIRPLRAKEDSQRWRADYDLVHAQCMAYRVRLFQYLLALDQHAKTAPKPKKPKSNEWRVGRTTKMLPPDEQQVKLTKVNLEELKQQELKARDLYQFVIKEHPRTPWARRASWELRHGFGMYFYDYFYDPRYAEVGKKIKLPKP